MLRFCCVGYMYVHRGPAHSGGRARASFAENERWGPRGLHNGVHCCRVRQRGVRVCWGIRGVRMLRRSSVPCAPAPLEHRVRDKPGGVRLPAFLPSAETQVVRVACSPAHRGHVVVTDMRNLVLRWPGLVVLVWLWRFWVWLWFSRCLLLGDWRLGIFCLRRRCAGSFLFSTYI